MTELPTGTVTFLLTDVVDSTRLWQEERDAMPALLARHDRLVDSCVGRHQGIVLKHRGEGDSVFSVFDKAHDGLAAACELQAALGADETLASVPLRVRMALHSGDVVPTGNDYLGTTVNLCARLRGAAHGGQTLLTQATYDLIRDRDLGDVSVTNLGEFRLRGFDRPRRVFQAFLRGCAADFPPIEARRTSSVHLPTELTEFIGRRRELDEVVEELRHARLLTLAGAGGCGKSRLAMRVARTVGDSFADGVWWVDLSGIDEPSQLCSVVASVLGIREEDGKSAQETVLEWIRPREMLLVLDSCDRLIAGCVDLVQLAISHCADVRILATSRQVLGLYGEHVWVVPPMSLRPAESLESGIRCQWSDAVQLFIERARLLSPRFEPSPVEVANIETICRKLDGIPLSIELAAGQAGILSVAQIADEVSDCFGAALTARHWSAERHKSLQAAMAWSYDLLAEDEMKLFRGLSVFRGSFDFGMAAAVTRSADDVQSVITVLGNLCDKSMIVVDHVDGATLYRLLEPLRQYGREMLVEYGEEADADRRHLVCIAELAERAETEIRGDQRASWLRRLEYASDDIHAALGWAAKAREVELGLRLGTAAWRHWHLQGLVTEGSRQLERLLALDISTVSPSLRANALHAAGTLAMIGGDNAHAAERLHGALDLRRSLGDGFGVAATLNNLGALAQNESRYADARKYYEESLILKRQTADQRAVAVALGNLAACCLAVSDYDNARTHAVEAESLLTGLDEGATTSQPRLCLAQIALDQGDYGTASELLKQLSDAAQESGSRSAIAAALLYMWHLDHVQGHVSEARTYLDECVAVQRAKGSRSDLALTSVSVALQLAAEGKSSEALRAFDQALELLGTGGRLRDMAHAQLGKGLVYLDMGRRADAARLVRTAMLAFREVELPTDLTEAIEGAARVLGSAGDVSGALTLAAAAEAERKARRTPQHPAYRATLAPTLDGARKLLDPAEAEQAAQLGKAMSLGQAADLALSALHDLASADSTARLASSAAGR